MQRRMVMITVIFSIILVLFCQSATTVKAADDSEEFYHDLARLIREESSSTYFDVIELTIGSQALTVDGETQILDVAPEIKNNRTMLPIRAVAEAAGATVEWESDTRTVFITSASGDEISCSIGGESITVNDTVSDLDVAPYVKNGRTYLPVRAVTEALEMDVEWDQETSTVSLTAPFQTGRILVLAETLDTSMLNAKAALYDGSGMWVLQFASPTKAREAMEFLTSKGIKAGADRYSSYIEEPDSDAKGVLSSGHYTWGAHDCNFDEYIENHSSDFYGSGIVAVVDTGVDANHSFLRGRVTAGRDFVDGDDDPTDENYHGTHVAGTIIDCVANTPVSILPVRVLDSDGHGYDSVISSGIKYAANQEADVINISLGGFRDNYSGDILDAALSYAVGRGSVVAISAGNDDMNTLYECPAHVTIPGTLIVAAGDSEHRKAYFSNYGNNIDLMAPGVDVIASVPGNTYRSLNGTSMAAPHVSAAAILLDLASGKVLSPSQLEEKVHAATTNGKWTDQYIGFGFLDMSKIDAPAPTQYTIYFHANGGKVTPSSKIVINGSTYGDLPTPTWSGYTFDGWYTAASGGAQITNLSTVSLTKDQTLYAHWVQNAISYIVTFDPNGGTVDPISKNVTNGNAYGDLPTPIWSGHTFDGWYTSVTDGLKVSETTIVKLTSNQTLYAHWSPKIASYTITFDPVDGSVTPASKMVTNGSTYGDLPIPVRAGYSFDGWFTSKGDGVKITENTRVNLTSDQVLYAHWTQISIAYTITFNANGGTVSPASKTVTKGSTYGVLPTPVWSGYTFDGWYTSVRGGTLIDSTTIVDLSADQTLYAHWLKYEISAEVTHGGHLENGRMMVSVWGETLNVHLISSGAWTASTSDSWIELYSVSSEEGYEYTDNSYYMRSNKTDSSLVVHVQMHEGLASGSGWVDDTLPERTGTITFRCGDATFDLHLTQYGYTR